MHDPGDQSAVDGGPDARCLHVLRATDKSFQIKQRSGTAIPRRMFFSLERIGKAVSLTSVAAAINSGGRPGCPIAQRPLFPTGAIRHPAPPQGT
jgi:hypothetical protein